MHLPQPGDKVKVVAHGTWAPLEQSGMLDNLPALTVMRQMPHEADRYELSDGTIQQSSALYLIERAGADVELEAYTVKDHQGNDVTHVRAAAPKAKGK